MCFERFCTQVPSRSSGFILGRWALPAISRSERILSSISWPALCFIWRAVCNGYQTFGLTCVNNKRGADNGLRRPSKATGIRVVPKYCKIRNGPFCGLFCRKDGNIGLLRGKVPRFCPKSTDVCPWEVRCFSTEARRKSGVFSCFSGVFALFSAICSVLMSRNGGRKGLKVCENDRSNAENRSGTGGGPCQNISRCLYFFYILGVFYKLAWGDFLPIVQ